jgi:hypothetical protein
MLESVLGKIVISTVMCGPSSRRKRFKMGMLAECWTCKEHYLVTKNSGTKPQCKKCLIYTDLERIGGCMPLILDTELEIFQHKQLSHDVRPVEPQRRN